MTFAVEHVASLAGLIEARARGGPESVVLRAPGRDPLTAAALLVVVESLRTALRERGVGPDGRVALLVRNGPEAAAAFLGIASSAACAPLNPTYTRAELEFALTDLHAEAVAVEAGLETPGPGTRRRARAPAARARGRALGCLRDAAGQRLESLRPDRRTIGTSRTGSRFCCTRPARPPGRSWCR